MILPSEQVRNGPECGLGQLQIRLSKFQLGMRHAKIASISVELRICQDLPLLQPGRRYPRTTLIYPSTANRWMSYGYLHVTWRIIRVHLSWRRLYHGDRRLQRAAGRARLLSFLASG